MLMFDVAQSENFAKSPDVFAPSHRQTIGFRIVAVVPDAALSECQLVLRLGQRSGQIRSVRVDAPGTEYAVAQNILLLIGGNRAPDLVGQFFANDAPFPDTAPPNRKRHQQDERPVDRELKPRGLGENRKEPDGSLVLQLSRRLPRCKMGKRCQQRQHVVEHMRRYCQ
jgi:hypothetical protein